ncbi:FAD-dependent oxidoreductase [Chloroflexota bacterium]
MKFKKLLEPGRIGQMELKNRIIMAPMGTNFASADGYVTERLKNYYAERAGGGVGMVMVGVLSIDAPRGNNMESQLVISDDKYITGLKEFTHTVHDRGARIAAQLVHAGKIAMMDIMAGIPPASPSQSSIAMKESLRELTRDEFLRMGNRFANMPRNMRTRELTVEEIERLIGRFAEAAERAKKAGFDGVELHAAHGYLLSSFLSPASNKRQDRYGGALENRATFLLEVIKAVRGKVGADFPLWCRIDCREFGIKDGITPEDGRRLAVLLEKAGVDAIHVSGYGGVVGGFIDAPLVYPPAHLVPYASEIKKQVNIPVIAVGRISPELGEKLLKNGKADFIAMGRPLIADPRLPAKLVSGNSKDIKPCLHCYRCVATHLIGESVVCTANPAAGKEADFVFKPAEKPGKVVVIGGGPSGMETARLAALRGHHVTLYEKERRPGGSLLFAVLVNPDNEDYLNWLVRQIKGSLVEVKLGKEVALDYGKKLAGDAVVAAIGSALKTPQIHGIDGRNVITGLELKSLLSRHPATGKLSLLMRFGLIVSAPLMNNLSLFGLRWLASRFLPVGKNVAVVGGDQVAIEIAQFLVELGRKVTVLTEGQWFAAEMSIPARWRVMRELRKAGVNLLNEVKIEQITGEGVEITETGQIHLIKADTVIIAGEAEAKPQVEKVLEGKQLIYVGDCKSVRMLSGAIEDGVRLGLKL